MGRELKNPAELTSIRRALYKTHDDLELQR